MYLFFYFNRFVFFNVKIRIGLDKCCGAIYYYLTLLLQLCSQVVQRDNVLLLFGDSLWVAFFLPVILNSKRMARRFLIQIIARAQLMT